MSMHPLLEKTFPGGPVVKTVFPMPELRIQSLVRELRVHVLHCVAKI